MTINRRFLLVRRPVGAPVAEDFQLEQATLSPPPAGAFILRNHYASLDPAQRGWMSDEPSYMAPMTLGAPVRASTVGRVETSNHPDFSPGDWVMGLNALEDTRWCSPAVSRPRSMCLR